MPTPVPQPFSTMKTTVLQQQSTEAKNRRAKLLNFKRKRLEIRSQRLSP
jgi:hypothetical protein